MPGICRPSARKKTLENVKRSDLSETDKKCIAEVFSRYDEITSTNYLIDKGALYDTVWDFCEGKKRISKKDILDLIDKAPEIFNEKE